MNVFLTTDARPEWIVSSSSGSAFDIAFDHCTDSVHGIDRRVHLGTTPSRNGLIGRATECRALEELLDAVREGQSRVLVVRADAGIGKSALLQHLVASAIGYRVAQATGVESEMELPFAALNQLCAPMSETLDVLPEPQREAARTAFGSTSGRPPDRLLIGFAILNQVTRVGQAFATRFVASAR